MTAVSSHDLRARLAVAMKRTKDFAELCTANAALAAGQKPTPETEKRLAAMARQLDRMTLDVHIRGRVVLLAELVEKKGFVYIFGDDDADTILNRIPRGGRKHGRSRHPGRYEDRGA